MKISLNSEYYTQPASRRVQQTAAYFRSANTFCTHFTKCFVRSGGGGDHGRRIANWESEFLNMCETVKAWRLLSVVHLAGQHRRDDIVGIVSVMNQHKSIVVGKMARRSLLPGSTPRLTEFCLHIVTKIAWGVGFNGSLK